MMPYPVARRPWWRKKRWAAALPLLVVAGYPACVAPVFYGVGRGWVPGWAAGVYLGPILTVVGEPGPSAAATLLQDYAQWWGDLGERHRRAASD